MEKSLVINWRLQSRDPRETFPALFPDCTVSGYWVTVDKSQDVPSFKVVRQNGRQGKRDNESGLSPAYRLREYVNPSAGTEAVLNAPTHAPVEVVADLLGLPHWTDPKFVSAVEAKAPELADTTPTTWHVVVLDNGRAEARTTLEGALKAIRATDGLTGQLTTVTLPTPEDLIGFAPRQSAEAVNQAKADLRLHAGSRQLTWEPIVCEAEVEEEPEEEIIRKRVTLPKKEQEQHV